MDNIFKGEETDEDCWGGIDPARPFDGTIQRGRLRMVTFAFGDPQYSDQGAPSGATPVVSPGTSPPDSEGTGPPTAAYKVNDSDY